MLQIVNVWHNRSWGSKLILIPFSEPCCITVLRSFFLFTNNLCCTQQVIDSVFESVQGTQAGEQFLNSLNSLYYSWVVSGFWKILEMSFLESYFSSLIKNSADLFHDSSFWNWCLYVGSSYYFMMLRLS